MSDHFTEERANEILRDAFGDVSVKQTMCGGCGRWSEPFMFAVGESIVGATPPGWQEPSGPFAWGAASKCPDCAAATDEAGSGP